MVRAQGSNATGARPCSRHPRVRRGGRVGLLTFGGPDTRLLPPRGGRGARIGLRRALGEGLAPDGTAGEPLEPTLVRMGRLARPGSLVVVVSDFAGPPDWGRSLAALSARHTVMAVEVYDPRERELPAVGRMAMVDPESGQRIEVDTTDRRLRERFASAVREEREAVAATLRRSGAEHVTLPRRRDARPAAAARFLVAPQGAAGAVPGGAGRP